MPFTMKAACFLAACHTLVLVAAIAHAAEWRFEGCEAQDVRALLGGGRAADWAGPWHGGDGWKMRSTLRIGCGEHSCTARTALIVVIDDERFLSDPGEFLESLPDRALRRDVIAVFGRRAGALRDDLGPGSFTSGDVVRRVFLHYGSVLRRISVRARTAAACPLRLDQCLFTSDLLAFVPYPGRTACGTFGYRT